MNVRRRKGTRPEARRINGAITRYAKGMKAQAALRHRHVNARHCRDGYVAKANRILAGKGKNGRTMNERLLLQHGIQRKEGGAK